MSEHRLDPLVILVLLAELVIITTSIGIVFLYDSWLGAWGFVLGFTLLICALPAIAGLDRQAPERKAKIDLAA